jgi:phage shock protein PspC (stress-responsive transcriptional regulator)
MEICPKCYGAIGISGVCSSCTPLRVSPPSRALYRNVPERRIAGVCASTALLVGLRPWVVRLGFVAALFATAGFAMLFYILLWLVIPFENKGRIPAMEMFENTLNTALDSKGEPLATPEAVIPAGPIDSREPTGGGAATL